MGLRESLAAEAFEHTASYDRAIADYMRGDSISGEFPATMNLSMHRKTQLRYGENPHQRAAVYSEPNVRSANVVSARRRGLTSTDMPLYRDRQSRRFHGDRGTTVMSIQSIAHKGWMPHTTGDRVVLISYLSERPPSQPFALGRELVRQAAG